MTGASKALKLVLLATALAAVVGCRSTTPQTGKPAAEACAGTRDPRCVVYESGFIETGARLDGTRLVYQLQGTGRADPADENAYCRGGYCAVAVLSEQANGRRRLLAHAESVDAGWYEAPRIAIGRGGPPLIVFASNSLGTGLFNDDIVLRDDGDWFTRIDVQSWKTEATGLTPGANTYFDWAIDYDARIGSMSLLARPGEWHRSPTGGCAEVFLELDGDALKMAAPPVRLAEGAC